MIQSGKIIECIQGKSVIQNVSRDIICSKWPVYHNNEIAGLFGYIRNLDSEMNVNEAMNLIDKNTGCHNLRGFIESLVALFAESQKEKFKFICLAIRIRNYEDLQRVFGSDFVGDAEKEVAAAIRNESAIDSVISYMGYGTLPFSAKSRAKISF